jgi:hypothetical protein
LERVADISPEDEDYVLDIAEAYIANHRPNAEIINGYTGETVHVANVGTQAAVDVIRGREAEEDDHRSFNLPGMIVEAVRFDHVIMRDTQGQTCSARRSQWNGAILTDSIFWECGFWQARFTNAQLQHVDFEGADLSEVDFRGQEPEDRARSRLGTLALVSRERCPLTGTAVGE